MIRRWIGALTATMISFTLAASINPSTAGTPCATIPAAAHRGGLERYTENSGNAYRDASNRGARLWETDVRFTADNVPVILHDPDVTRTTTGTGRIADLTHAQVSGLRTRDGQPILTLADFIDDAHVDGPRLLVELKTNPTPTQWKAFNAAIGSRPGIPARVVLMSFDPATLTAAKTYAPALARGLLQNPGDTDPAEVLTYANILVKHHHSITTDRMRKWTAAGLTVYAWTANKPDQWQRLSGYRLGAVITDRPGAYLAWQKSRTC